MASVRTRVALLAAFALLAAGAGPAVADVTISAATGEPYRYSAPSFAMTTGERAFFQNPEDVSHNVRATAKGPDGGPAFRSRTIGLGATAVEGVQYLGPGSYSFLCTVHSGMTARLDVAAGGSGPEARPDIEVFLPAQTLGTARRTGKIRVRVRALTASRDVALLVREGGRRIASAKRIDLAAGTTRVIRVGLTPAGRRALADGPRAALTVRGSVAFGKPDTARRTLR
jgi:plastocyanin